MVSPFTGYVTTDGKPFEHEIDAIRHEARLTLAKSFPELKGPQHDADTFDRLALILAPYAHALGMGRPPEKELPESDPPKSDPPKSAWPDVVADAMSEDNLGEPISLMVPRASTFRPSVEERWNSCAAYLKTGPDGERLPFAHCNDPASYDTSLKVYDSDAPTAPPNWSYTHSFRRLDNAIVDTYWNEQRGYEASLERSAEFWFNGMVESGEGLDRFHEKDRRRCSHSWQRAPGSNGLIDMCIHCREQRA